MLVVSMSMHNKVRKYLRIILNKNIVQTFILRSKTHIKTDKALGNLQL